MSKIVLAILMAAAFVYALWLVLFRRALPHPGQATGLRRRFYLATLLFVAAVDGQAASQITCYEVAIDPQPTTTPSANERKLSATLQAVWRALDPKQSDDFRQKLEAAVSQGVVRQKTADMLAVAYAELAYHKDRTRGPNMVTCYRPSRIGMTLMNSREQAFKQLELLAKARETGAIDAETASKAQAALAGEIEMLHRARLVAPGEVGDPAKRLVESYQNKQVIPSVSAETAAELIVQMEGGQMPAVPPGKRLLNMRKQINGLFNEGPLANDWRDPAISPGMAQILMRAGLLKAEDSLSPTCYSRSAVPVRERSEELAALQKRLLDRHSQSGILAGKTFQKIMETQHREQTELEARVGAVTEQEVKAYQEKVRAVVRGLYETGELPPRFVEEIESILGCEIVDIKLAQALRAEAGFWLRGHLHPASYRQALAWLEQRDLIPSVKNHRGEMTGPSMDDPPTAEVRTRLEAVKSALGKDEEVALPGDEAVRIARSTLPVQELDYRLRMRRAVRILVKNDVLDSRSDFQSLQECLGIPIIGTLEGK